MTDNPQPEKKLEDEFRNLGENLVEILRTAWDAPERKRIQGELERGVNELGATLRQEAEHFAASPGGQQIKAEVQDFSERVRSGEIQTKAREELLNALQLANAELQKVIQQWSAGRDSSAGGESQTTTESAAPDIEKPSE